MKKLVLPEYQTPVYNGPCNLRVTPDTMARLRELSLKTRMGNLTQLSSQLLNWAMDNVVLKPAEIFDLNCPAAADDEE